MKEGAQYTPASSDKRLSEDIVVDLGEDDNIVGT